MKTAGGDCVAGGFERQVCATHDLEDRGAGELLEKSKSGNGNHRLLTLHGTVGKRR